MGKHRRVSVQRAGPGRIMGLTVGVLATFGAWCVLVYYAIQLGPEARGGETNAWVLLGVATVGAIGCLFLALILGGRLREAVRGARDPASSGRRTGSRAETDAPPAAGRRIKR